MPGLGLATALMLLFLWAPLLILMAYSFNANRVALVWSGFSARWFAFALADEDLRRAAWNSALVAGVATPVATALALPAALAFERGRLPLRGLSEALVALPLIAPEIVTAVATLVFLQAIGLHTGLGNVMLAHVAFCIPFALLPIRARLRDMPRSIEEAARDLYADGWTTFRLVTLPLLAPAVAAGAALAFVVSVDDFLITLMVAPAGATTLPVYLYSMLRVGISPEANAAATMLLGASAAAVTLAFLVAERGRR